jgi:hypothetical protein
MTAVYGRAASSVPESLPETRLTITQAVRCAP